MLRLIKQSSVIEDLRAEVEDLKRKYKHVLEKKIEAENQVWCLEQQLRHSIERCRMLQYMTIERAPQPGEWVM